jgi:phage terminase large subunit-like protein
VVKRTTAGDEEVTQVDIKEVQHWIKAMHSRWGFACVVLDQYNSMETIQALQDYMDIREFIWSMATKTKAYSKLRELFNAGLMRLPANEKGISQLKNLTVVHRANGQWVVTGGDKAAVDDYCAALAANVLMMEAPEQDVEWIEGLVA